MNCIGVKKTGLRKNALSAALILGTGIALTGCGLVDMPELTEEQSALVTEYAAGLILKYDVTAMGDKLLSEEELAKGEQEEAEQRQKEREAREAAEEYWGRGKVMLVRDYKLLDPESNVDDSIDEDDVIDVISYIPAKDRKRLRRFDYH